MKTLAAVLRAVSDRRPYGDSQPLQLEELELVAPRAGRLLVRIEAAGVCHSVLLFVAGPPVRAVRGVFLAQPRSLRARRGGERRGRAAARPTAPARRQRPGRAAPPGR